MAYSFPSFKSLRLLSVGLSNVYRSCYRSQRPPDLAETNKQLFSDDSYNTRNYPASQPDGRSRFRLVASCAEAPGAHFAYFIPSLLGHDSETTLQKAYIQKQTSFLLFCDTVSPSAVLSLLFPSHRIFLLPLCTRKGSLNLHTL